MSKRKSPIMQQPNAVVTSFDYWDDDDEPHEYRPVLSAARFKLTDCSGHFLLLGTRTVGDDIPLRASQQWVAVPLDEERPDACSLPDFE